MSAEPSAPPTPRPDGVFPETVNLWRFRAAGFASQPRPLAGCAALAALLLLWATAARLQADPIVLPTPGAVWAALAEMARTGELQVHVAASLHRLLLGWSLGAGLGLAAGLLIALFPLARAAMLPVVTILFATPKIALLPLFIVWLGIDEASKIATIALGVFSPMAVATCAGVDSVDLRLIRMAQSFDLSMAAILRKVVLPGAAPALLAGVRVTGSIAIVLLVAAEMIGARHGLGALALNSGGLMRTDRVFAAVALLAAFGLVLSLGVGAAERRLLRRR